MIFEPVRYNNAETFVMETVKRFKNALSNKKGFGFISGGIDSTTCAKLISKSVGDMNFIGIHFDHGGMRENECKNVLFFLNKDCGVPVIFRDFSEVFLKNIIEAGPDAEKKRNAVSKTYFNLALEEARKLGALYWVQGTIEPDVLETTKLKLKRQHNVLLEEQEKEFNENHLEVVEPLIHLRKNHVREVARLIGIPASISDRKPFPGPGLYCRAIGQVSREKMNTLRKADSIVMEDLEACTKRFSKEDFQCLCAIVDNKTTDIDIKHKAIKSKPKVTEDKVTGTVEDKRTYTNLLLIDSDSDIVSLIDASKQIISENSKKGIGRVAVLLKSVDRNKKYIAILRSILTKDFTRAEVTPIEFKDLKKMADKLLNTETSIGEVYYDITPKPPATIEFE